MSKLRIRIALIVIAIGGVAFGAYQFLAPPTSLAARILLERWKVATEAGDWNTVWSLMGPPSSKIEPFSWRPNYSEEGSIFINERQASRPGVLRRVRVSEQSIGRMTHVDDPYTFWITVDIDYVDPQSGEMLSTEPLRFYITKRAGKLGIWGFDTPDW